MLLRLNRLNSAPAIQPCAIILLLGLALGSCQPPTPRATLDVVYPNGTHKALVMSYDDGPVEDRALARLFTEHGIVGTFNVNSGFLGTIGAWPVKGKDTVYQAYLPVEDVLTVYAGHEVAGHGTYHQDFTSLNQAELEAEIRTDKQALELLVGHSIVSLAYPFGKNNRRVAKTTGEQGYTNARTVADTHGFDLPRDWLRWDPTCHDSQAVKLLDAYAALPATGLAVFCVWGHAWELKDPARWDGVAAFCQSIGDRDDTWYTGAGELAAYGQAVQALQYTPGKCTNPSGNAPIHYLASGERLVLLPGERVFLP